MNATDVELPLALIVSRDRLREVDPGTVNDLAVSIGEVGLAQAITVRAIYGDEGETRYELVIGAHRLAAHRRLGLATIRCRVVQVSDQDARQLEIDENLVRGDLSALEFARFVAERLEIYALRRPETVVAEPEAARGRGRPPKNFVRLAKGGGFVGALMGFAEETAKDVKLSRRSIYRAVETWNGLPPALRERLRGTPVSKNESLLRQLAGMGDKAEQAAVAEHLISGQARSVADGLALAAGNMPMRLRPTTPTDETLQAFRKLWKAASRGGRDAILRDLAGTPLPVGWIVREDRA
jgi:ParB family chromosome partitioning protein